MGWVHLMSSCGAFWGCPTLGLFALSTASSQMVSSNAALVGTNERSRFFSPNAATFFVKDFLPGDLKRSGHFCYR